MGLMSFMNKDPEKDFEKQLKRVDKECSPYTALNHKLNMAFNHSSIKSAFWWYENLPQKPNTGSDADILLLHKKFKTSLESRFYTREVSRDVQIKFLDLVLPDDVDYASIIKEANNKSEYIEWIMKVYEKFHEDAQIWTPFITPLYWMIYHRDEKFDENAENPHKIWLRNFLQKNDL